MSLTLTKEFILRRKTTIQIKTSEVIVVGKRLVIPGGEYGTVIKAASDGFGTELGVWVYFEDFGRAFLWNGVDGTENGRIRTRNIEYQYINQQEQAA